MKKAVASAAAAAAMRRLLHLHAPLLFSLLRRVLFLQLCMNF